MQLRIVKHGSASHQGRGNHVITSFSDLDALAREVARDVKTWAGRVPLRKQGSTFVLRLTASWGEPETKKKRK